jgi:type II secretory pathway pseudopilin PulG
MTGGSRKKKNRCQTPVSQRGFTYIAVLITIAVMAAGLAAAATIYSQVAQREKEVELLFVGDQYRQAILSYYERAPGGAKRYPQKLEDLLEDNRFPTITRHLRRLYKDPITGQDMVPVEAPGGGIMGVASASDAPPIKSAGFRPKDDAFVDAQHYADWKFAYSPPGLSASQPGNNTNPARQ